VIAFHATFIPRFTSDAGSFQGLSGGGKGTKGAGTVSDKINSLGCSGELG
jgi:hypothetical protein